MRRTLRVAKETLTELTTDELTFVAGTKTQTIVCPSIPLWSCISCDRLD